MKSAGGVRRSRARNDGGAPGAPNHGPKGHVRRGQAGGRRIRTREGPGSAVGAESWPEGTRGAPWAPKQGPKGHGERCGRRVWAETTRGELWGAPSQGRQRIKITRPGALANGSRMQVQVDKKFKKGRCQFDKKDKKVKEGSSDANSRCFHSFPSQ